MFSAYRQHGFGIREINPDILAVMSVIDAATHGYEAVPGKTGTANEQGFSFCILGLEALELKLFVISSVCARRASRLAQ